MILPRARPWAALYRGPHQVPGCPEAAADLLRAAGLRVRHVGRGERLELSRALDAGPAVLVHPGGGELEEVWPELSPHRERVRRYVAEGGAYLGLCLGGYLAGRSPGYGLLPGDTDQLAGRPDAALTHTRPAVVAVDWRPSSAGTAALGGGARSPEGAVRRRSLYAQDPPVFLLDRDDCSDDVEQDGSASPGPAEVVATYAPGREVAALVCRFGRGRVAVVGPHPEATPGWFTDDGLPPAPAATDLGLDLLARLGVGSA